MAWKERNTSRPQNNIARYAEILFAVTDQKKEIPQLRRISIRAAKRKEKVTADLQLHSDQGFQYTSQSYFKPTKSYSITSSMSRRGNPYDNALAENFFSILKTECIYRTKLKTYEQNRLLIDEYIYFYNNQRLQLKTKLTHLKNEVSLLPKI